MSMKKINTVQGSAAGSNLVGARNADLDAIMKAARERIREPRLDKLVEPLTKLEDIPESQRPYSKYLANRNARPSTIAGYQRKAARARHYLIEAGMDAKYGDVPLGEFPWNLITPAVAAKYAEILSRQYSNTKSRENLIGVVRRLVHECAKAGLISYADRERLLDAVPVPSTPVKRPGRELKESEMLSLLTAKASRDERLNARNSAIIAVFLSTGLRVSEVAELRVEDVKFDDRGAGLNIRRTKSGKAHFAWLGLTATHYVREWLAVRGSGAGALFVAVRQKDAHLSAGTLASIVTKQVRAAGLKGFACHDFRRTFATRLLRGGADPFVVQRLLGHKNVNTTLIYDYRTELESRAIIENLAIPQKISRDPEARS